jgi:hypothetical protein
MRVARIWSAVALGLGVMLSASSSAAQAPAPASQKIIARIDLSRPFHLAPGAAFTATQGPPVPDPNYEGASAPGRIHLCVRTASSLACDPDLDDALKVGPDDDEFSEIHYLENSGVVHPRGTRATALLYLQVASFHAGNGSQIHAAMMLAYRTSAHRFERIFQEQFGGNMNQEVRYMHSGPLRGSMIAVHPTDNAPFGYWIAVNRLTSGYHYRQVLRYRSATRYNDGNPLAVIDSEMPNILSRLDLWRPGAPLPLPESGCARPRLVEMELWCS